MTPDPIKRLVRTCLGFSLLLATGCQALGIGPEDCVTFAAPGLRVFIEDAATNEPVTSGGIVVASDGAFADTVQVSSGPREETVAELAEERSGTYTVRVEMLGYEEWAMTDVQVQQADGCHVETEEITAQVTEVEPPEFP